jgi:hypothetical protein
LAYRLAIVIKDVSKTREEQDANHAHQSAKDPQPNSRPFHAVLLETRCGAAGWSMEKPRA